MKLMNKILRIIPPTAIALLTVCNIVDAQIPMDVETGKFIYEEVVQAEGMSKAQLFELAEKWFTNSSHIEGDSLLPKDSDQKSISFIKNFKFNKNIIRIMDTTAKNRLTMNLSIYFKEGRFKYKIDNMIYHYYLIANTSQSLFTSPLEDVKYLPAKKEKLYTMIDERIRKMITQMKDFMRQKVKTDDEYDNW